MGTLRQPHSEHPHPWGVIWSHALAGEQAVGGGPPSVNRASHLELDTEGFFSVWAYVQGRHKTGVRGRAGGAEDERGLAGPTLSGVTAVHPI